MSKFHNSISGEKLALHFHAFFILAALFFAGFSVVICVMFEPFVQYAHDQHLVGLYTAFLGVWILAILSAIMNAVQVLWHLLACREHKDHLKELEDHP